MSQKLRVFFFREGGLGPYLQILLVSLLHSTGVIVLIIFLIEPDLYVLVLYFIVLYLGLVVYSFLLCVTAKWLLIGKYKEGVYKLWGSYYIRWWVCNQLQSIFEVIFPLAATKLLNFVYRCLGSKIGNNVILLFLFWR